MHENKMTVVELILFAATRVALGVGIGLLLSRRLTRGERKAAGLSLAVVGGLTTIPFALRARSLRTTEREMRSVA